MDKTAIITHSNSKRYSMSIYPSTLLSFSRLLKPTSKYHGASMLNSNLYMYHMDATKKNVWSFNIIQRLKVRKENKTYQDTPAAHDYQSTEALKHPRLAYLNLGTVRKMDEANLRYPFIFKTKRQIEIEHMSHVQVFNAFSVFICFLNAWLLCLKKIIWR